MKNCKSIYAVFSAILLLAVLSSFSNAQSFETYPKGKIVLTNGSIIEGEDLLFDGKSASISLGDGLSKTYEVSEISQIMVKYNRANKGCMYGALGCAA